jgi:hypothetical protein
MKVIRINEHTFNADWAQSIDEQTFVDTLLPEPFWNGVTEKEEKLRAAWRLMNGKMEDEVLNKPLKKGKQTKGAE